MRKVTGVLAILTLVSSAHAGSFGFGAADNADGRLSLGDCKVTVALHSEHPGATGEVSVVGGDWSICYDFSDGGHGLGVLAEPRTPIWAETVEFEAKHTGRQIIGIIVRDARDQRFRALAEPHPDRWWTYSFSLRGPWAGSWGPGDGVLRQPVKSVEIILERTSKGTADPSDKGETFVRNVGYHPAKKDDWTVDGAGVRYLVTDFRPGDMFSAGPRAFFRSDLKRRYDGGEIEVDFSKAEAIALSNEIPVWGAPKEFLLSMEAPLESAGLELEVVFRTGVFRRRIVGRLKAADGEHGRICQTFSIPGFLEKGWITSGKGSAKSLPRSKRFVQLVVRRGAAPAKKLKFKPVRLEAVVRAGVDLPPLLAVPSKGDEPPQMLDVGFLNLQGARRTNGAVKVTVSNWSGRELGSVISPLPPVRQGERGFAHVALPPVTEKVNFLSYSCELMGEGRRDPSVTGWTTSWTRPLAGCGDTVKRPDLPWGFGVYLHRTEDLFAYQSAYGLDCGDEAFALMERKAELAQAMGVKWERVEFQPQAICRDPGKFDFTVYDRLVDCAERHGISLYAVFSHYWPMRGKKRADQHDLTAYTLENYTNWVATLSRSVERYRGRIAGWEIWNEPNIGFWDGPKEDYPKLVNLAYPAVKAADPGARVIACSTAGVDLKFIDMCLGKGLRFDDLSTHPYRGGPDERGFMADLAAVTNRSHGTKTWLTELGWPTGCDRNTYTERQQAAYFVRAYLAAAGCGCSAAINGYDFVDDGFNVLERENNFGILRRDLTPKPAYRALAKVFLSFTEGRPSISETKLADGGSAWVFRMGGRSAVWSDCEALLKVAADGRAHVSNPMDEPVGEGESLTLRTGPLDVYFLDRDVVSVEEASADAVAGPEFAVRVDNGVPRIVRDGMPVVPRLFECNPSNPQVFWKHVLSDGAIRREYAYAKEQGVELVSLSGIDLLWPGDDIELRKRNISLLVDTFRSVHPDAFIIPRLILRPTDPWRKLHPEALTTFSDGSRGQIAAYESPVFRRDLREALTATLRFIEKKYGAHIAGYQIGGGQWCEWFYEGFGTANAKWPGYDPATKAAFRKWMKARYPERGDDGSVEPPTAAQMAVADRPLHTPKECPLAIDYIDFLNENTADIQLEAARIVRETVGKGRLVFSFFCYLTTCMCDYNAGGCGRSGHLAMEKVMASPDIDVFTSPIGYHDRRIGGMAYAQACAESLMKRGKVYLSEDDSPTHLAELKPAKYPPLGNGQGWLAKDAEESLLILRRNLATMYCCNYPIWWMDIHGSGWFDDPKLWPEMSRFRATERRLMANPRPFEPEVALAMDVGSRRFVYGQGTGYRLLFQSNIRMAANLGHTGTPYGHYLADDVLAGLFPKVKFAVFNDSYAMTSTKRREMRRYADGHSCLWLYAPGYIDLDSGEFSASAVAEATGFEVEILKDVCFGYVFDNEILKRLGVPPISEPQWQDDSKDRLFPDTDYFSPVPKEGDLVLARYVNGNKPAIVIRRKGDCLNVFCGSIGLSAKVLSALARFSGVRMYSSPGSVALANGDYLAVVSAADGTVEVKPPKAGKYRDALTGRTLGEGAKLSVPMHKGETIVLEESSSASMGSEE